MTSNLKIFYALLRKKWRIERPQLFDNIVNILIWVGCTILVGGYLLQAQGVSKAFGAFQLAGACASVGIFGMWPYASDLLNDIENSNVAGYHLMLPCSAWIVFATDIVIFAMRAIIQTIAIVPLGKLLLWNNFALTDISFIPLVLVVVIANLFSGIFAFWATSVVKRSESLSQIWSRFLFPAWFLGGFQFTFATVCGLSPWLGCVMAINPVTYIMEGTRGALLGIPSINPWLCMGALILLGAILFWDAMRRLRKQLDFVS
jgi:ABC-2 type transport system permease protein